MGGSEGGRGRGWSSFSLQRVKGYGKEVNGHCIEMPHKVHYLFR